MSTGKISNLPNSIVIDKRSFENALYPAKLAYGPTASKAGPILDIQLIAAEKLLKKPCSTSYVPASDTTVIICPLIGSKESNNTTSKSKKKYKVIKANTSLIVFSSTFSLQTSLWARILD